VPSRRTSGLGAGSKIPLRGFTQLLKNLEPAVRAKLESAFSDAENLIDFHSRTVPELQTRRRFSGTIQTPVVTTEATIVGAFVRWDRLDDPRIAFYEIEMADDNTFADPESYTSLETFFTIENVTTTKFVRVRGVRSNGEAGLYSTPTKIRPTITAPDALSAEFYPGYSTNSYATVGNSRRYSGGDRYNDALFYTVLDETFYADRYSGGFSVWGNMSNRLARMLDARAVPWDRVRFKLNGIAVQDGYFPLWTNMMDEDANAAANENDRDDSGNLMSFYTQGGYTASFGPYNLNIPNTLAGEGPLDPGRVMNISSSLDEAGIFYWSDANNAKHPSRWDQAQFSSPSYSQDGLTGESDPGAPVDPQHEAYSQSITEGQKTEYLWFHDFNFSIPAERVITGIKAQVSRRQPNLVSQGVIDDLGFASVNRPLNDSINQPAGVAWEGADILTDVDYGDYIPFDNLSDKLQTDMNESPPLDIEIGNEFTISTWVNFSEGAPAQLGGLAGFSGRTNNFNRCRLVRGAGAFSAYLYAYLRGNGGTGERVYRYTTAFLNLNQWYHVVVTKDSVHNVLLYLDGQLKGWSLVSGAALVDFIEAPGDINTAGPAWGAAHAPKGGFGQTAIWNTVLDAGDVEAIYDLKMTGDYRFSVKSANLKHYYLAFPDQGDIQDNAVYLTDRSPADIVRVRSDLSNKAATDESWPQLSDFFSTVTRQYSYLPLAESDGIPHDNHNAIGYQDYGGEGDLWGGTWTPDQINDFYFGFVIQAINNPTQAANSHAYVDHGKLTIYYIPEEDRSMRVQAEVAVANQFYIERETFGALFNIIEMGEKLAEDYVRCQAGT